MNFLCYFLPTGRFRSSVSLRMYKPPEGVSSSSPQVAYVAVAGWQDYGQIGMTLACLLFTFGTQKDSSVQKTGFPWYPVNESFIVAFLSSCSSNSLEQITHKEVWIHKKIRLRLKLFFFKEDCFNTFFSWKCELVGWIRSVYTFSSSSCRAAELRSVALCLLYVAVIWRCLPPSVLEKHHSH